MKAQERLQAGGVAAGAAVHVKELLTDPHVAARRQLGALSQPGHEQPLEVLMGPALFENIPAPQPRPAPAMATDTRDICRELLDMSNADIDELIAAEVLDVPNAGQPQP